MRLVFGPFTFDSRLRTVVREGNLIDLSPKAFLLLETLIEARPAPVAKEALYDRLWPKTFVEAGNLHNLISEIRRSLADDNHRIVRTVHGEGYAFDARELEIAPSLSRFLLWIGDEVVRLKNGESIVGRDPEVDIVIDAADISRQHARLFVSDDHVVIEDLGSKNGTFIGSDRITTPRTLQDGDDIFLGKTPVLLRKRGGIKSTVTTG